MLRAFLSALTFGASIPAVAALAESTNPTSLAALLYSGAALFAAAKLSKDRILHQQSQNKTKKRVPRRDVLLAATALISGGLAGPLLFTHGLSRTGPVAGGILLNLELAFTILLAALISRRVPSRRVIAGSTLVVAAGLTAGLAGPLLQGAGALLLTGACLMWAVDNIATAEIRLLSPASVVLGKGVLAVALAVASLSFLPKPEPLLVLAALAVGAVGYGLSPVLWVQASHDLGADRTQAVFSTGPLLGSLIALPFAAAAPLLPLLPAAVGVALLSRQHHEHAHEHTHSRHSHLHQHDDDHHEGEEHGHALKDDRTHEHPHEHKPQQHAHPHGSDVHHRHRR